MFKEISESILEQKEKQPNKNMRSKEEILKDYGLVVDR